jgi:hypothetical protein
MSLTIFGTDPCWEVLYKQLKRTHPQLCNKDIALSINCQNIIPNKKNIIWLHESPAIIKNTIEEIKNNITYYINNNIIVYTCIDELQTLAFVKYMHPSMSSWIQTPTFMPIKSKLISMISSNKNFTLGHQIRRNIINNLPPCVDLYGRGFKEIENKIEGLKDYCFSIAIENDDTNSWFTEKLLDCFLTCTIPIYWGASTVDNIFNEAGILRIKDLNDICSLSYLDYNNKIEAVKENYYKALEQNISPMYSLIKILEEN